MRILALVAVVDAFSHFTISNIFERKGKNNVIVRFMGKEWDRLGLSSKESDEIGRNEEWYILNCVAGGEKECLFQCQGAVKGLLKESDDGDSQQHTVTFVVPTADEIASRGNSISSNSKKILYPGYVFGKFKLTPTIYETLMGLSSVKSFMGSSIRHQNKRSYKLKPPIPTPITAEDAIHFGLVGAISNSNTTDDKTSNDSNNVISSESNNNNNEFSHLSIGGMVKIVHGKHKHEDGIVKKIKDGKVYVRLYSYGTIFDEWLNPSELVPLTEEQVRRSMATTPSEPITQQQFMQQIRSNEKRKSTSITKDDLFSSLGVKQRNRKQDRIGRAETTAAKSTIVSSSISTQQQEKLRQEREEWFASQKLPKAKEYDDNQYNVDAQWGRRKKQKEKPEEEAITVKNRKDRTKSATPTVDLDDEDYWSDFLASSSSSSESSEHDDLFSDLLAELSHDVKERKEEGISTDSLATKGKEKEEQDIFNSLEESLLQKQDKKKLIKMNKEVLTLDEQAEFDSSLTVEEEDFFSKLDEELTDLLEGGNESESYYVDGGSNKDQKSVMINDFFSASKTEQMKRSNNNGSNSYGEEKIYRKEEVVSWTLATLKEKLRERGLKVSGKKSELIERLLSV
jgi:transcription antitermination factor NusG